MQRDLITISYSPWSEKARWALDSLKLNYQEIPYLIMIDDWWVRLQLKRFWGDFTVPILVEKEPIKASIEDSYGIAMHVSKSIQENPLFPAEHASEIEALNKLSEKSLSHGRVMGVIKTLQSRETAIENLPPFIPKFLRPLFTFLVPVALWGLDQQFKFGPRNLEMHRAEMRKILLELRPFVKQKKFIFSKFTFADIAVAGALHFVKPPQYRKMKIGKHTRVAMTDDVLVAEFSDLLEWRDWLYSEKRDA